MGLAALEKKSYDESVIGMYEDEYMQDEEHYDEATDVYAYGLCMLEMATGEVAYSECSGPADMYKKVVANVKPMCLEKVKSKEVREIIEQCMELMKEDRPGVKEILEKDFFSE